MYVRRMIAVLLLAPGALAAQMRPEPPTITVNATASVEREPERATLILAVESEATSAQAAAQANADAMTRVLAALRQKGFSGANVRTLSLQLDPVYTQGGPNSQEPPRISGYRASNMVRIVIDSIARVGGVVDAAIGAGANRVAGLNFELKDPDAARQEALSAAVARARRDAQTVATAAGRVLGPPLSITLSSEQPGPRPMYAGRVLMAQNAETPVEGGAIQITATVHVVFRLDAS